MNTSSLSFDVSPSDPSKPLGIEVWVNDQLIENYDCIDQLRNIVYVFDDEIKCFYTVKIVVKNKKPSHTEINDAGEIVQDSLVSINNFKVDDINVDTIVYEKAVYTHDFNGSQSEIKDRFYGPAGCNGTIEIGFTSPVHIWLLENM